MATWVTHLMIADIVLDTCQSLDRRGFCVGSIAPDCNVENEDWTAFTPPREATHWMNSQRKIAADCDRFLNEYLFPRMQQKELSHEEYTFLLGYWAHLVEDAEFQRYIRDEERVRASWDRILADPVLGPQAEAMPATFDSVKLLIPKAERMRDISAIESKYLSDHPSSGFLTEILPLTEFPDYIDYLPTGSIVRKIGVMGRLPVTDDRPLRFLAISREEYAFYVQNTSQLVINGLKSHNLIP